MRDVKREVIASECERECWSGKYKKCAGETQLRKEEKKKKKKRAKVRVFIYFLLSGGAN